MQGKPRFSYGSSLPWELLWENGGRGKRGEGVCEGCPAWLFSLSRTFPMWFCICVFDHVNPCLAPTPPPPSPCHRLTATHTSAPDRNWQPTLSHRYTPPLQNGTHSPFLLRAAYPPPWKKNKIPGRGAVPIDSLQHFIKEKQWLKRDLISSPWWDSNVFNLEPKTTVSAF